MWKDSSQWQEDGAGFYAALIIYDTDNGILKVEQQQENSWEELETLLWLGNQYVLNEPYNYRDVTAPKEVTIRVSDMSGELYGTYTLSLEICSDICLETVSIQPL